MTPIIRQCLDRLDKSLETVDEEGNVKMRAESAVMIKTWLTILSLSQEPLGEEFQKILDDNIWDLYVSDDDETDSTD